VTGRAVAQRCGRPARFACSSRARVPTGKAEAWPGGTTRVRSASSRRPDVRLAAPSRPRPRPRDQGDPGSPCTPCSSWSRTAGSAERLAEFFQVSVPQAAAVIEYIRSHHAEVKAEFEQIRARHAKGNPPHIQARLAKSRQQFLAKLTDAQRRRWEELTGDRAAG
jgi:hypothetical protein